MTPRFENRRGAGRFLAQRLGAYANRSDVLVLALPRGGVPVAFEVARALRAPLDVFIVRKLGVPGHEELAMGAIASGGTHVVNQDVVRALGITREELRSAIQVEERELARRERLYHGDAPRPHLAGRTVILIDDGLATGSTMFAAVRALRTLGPARIVIGVPISSPDTCAAFSDIVDEIVCAATPERFSAVGLWYEDFTQTTDEEVRMLLDAAAREQLDRSGAAAPATTP
jgi:putative phosphoribosyl transferase